MSDENLPHGLGWGECSPYVWDVILPHSLGWGECSPNVRDENLPHGLGWGDCSPNVWDENLPHGLGRGKCSAYVWDVILPHSLGWGEWGLVVLLLQHDFSWKPNKLKHGNKLKILVMLGQQSCILDFLRFVDKYQIS